MAKEVQAARVQLLRDTSDFLTDEQEIVRLEAFAGLSQILSFYPAPKTEITQVGLLDSLTSQYKSVFVEGKASVDLQELMVTQSVQFLH
jgi:hypothetical protein